MNDPIGGYFELEFPQPKAPLHPQAAMFQSARAAYLALLRAGKPKRVWMPHYICSTMLMSMDKAGVEAVFYKIDADFYPAEEIELQDGDWLLYVNYFGICNANVTKLLTQFDRERVIIDASQALFAPPADCLATIYSPRKFFGIPDGGMLVASIPVDAPSLQDKSSFDRSIPLLKRLAFTPEDAYLDHRRAEQTLFGQEPAAMSKLTEKIMSGIDHEHARSVRNTNFSFLHKHLANHNLLHINSANIDGALCYPLLTKNLRLREALIDRRIFTATYWQDVLHRLDESAHECLLTRGIVPLPCDQRYGAMEMELIVETCREQLQRPPGH